MTQQFDRFQMEINNSKKPFETIQTFLIENFEVKILLVEYEYLKNDTIRYIYEYDDFIKAFRLTIPISKLELINLIEKILRKE